MKEAHPRDRILRTRNTSCLNPLDVRRLLPTVDAERGDDTVTGVRLRIWAR